MKTVLLTLLVLLYTGLTEAAISTHGKNSLGAIIYQDNPFTYKAGAIVKGVDVDEGAGLNLEIQSVGTYSLFTEWVLLCGSPVDALNGKKNPMVIAYETVAHRTVEGIGCHNLVKVYEIK
jgi:hypothetical protein